VKLAFDELVNEGLIEEIGEVPKIDVNGIRKGTMFIYGLSEAGLEALRGLDLGGWLGPNQDQ
jgi:hypothetical protein